MSKLIKKKILLICAIAVSFFLFADNINASAAENNATTQNPSTSNESNVDKSDESSKNEATEKNEAHPNTNLLPAQNKNLQLANQIISLSTYFVQNKEQFDYFRTIPNEELEQKLLQMGVVISANKLKDSIELLYDLTNDYGAIEKFDPLKKVSSNEDIDTYETTIYLKSRKITATLKINSNGIIEDYDFDAHLSTFETIRKSGTHFTIGLGMIIGIALILSLVILLSKLMSYNTENDIIALDNEIMEDKYEEKPKEVVDEKSLKNEDDDENLEELEDEDYI